jgi:hypothetical protein
VVALAAVAAAGGALLLPAQGLAAYERDTRPYNSELQNFADGVLAARRPGEPLLIDDRLRLYRKGSRSRYRPLTLMLELAGAPPEPVAISELAPTLAQRPGSSVLLISAPQPDLGGNGMKRYQQLAVDWDRPEDEVKIRVYRVEDPPP